MKLVRFPGLPFDMGDEVRKDMKHIVIRRLFPHHQLRPPYPLTLREEASLGLHLRLDSLDLFL